MRSLKIIVPENFKEFGEKVNKHIGKIRSSSDNYLVDLSLVRFNNGEGKAVINESIRDADLYILSDISNYDVTYEVYHPAVDAYMKEHNVSTLEELPPYFVSSGDIPIANRIAMQSALQTQRGKS